MDISLLLHFLKLDIQTESLEIAEWVDRLYISNDLTARFPDQVTSLKLLIERKDSPSAHRIAVPANTTFAENNLCAAPCFYQNGHFFSINTGEYWHELDYDLHADVMRINVGGRLYETGQFLVTNILRPILQSFILPFYGIKPLHGAILSRGDTTLLLIGRGGMGKTTTAVQSMRAGYDVLSDDGPFVFSDRGEPYVLSSLDYLHFTENTMNLFPELNEYRVGVKDHREKFCVRLSDVQSPSALSQPRRITHCVRLKRRQDATTPCLTKLRKSIVHRELIDDSMIIFRRPCFRDNPRFESYVASVFDLLSKLVQRADAFDLEFADRHLSDIPSVLDRL